MRQRAKINALMNRKEFDLMFANLIHQLTLCVIAPTHHRPHSNVQTIMLTAVLKVLPRTQRDQSQAIPAGLRT
jgi:hypothetical protein